MTQPTLAQRIEKTLYNGKYFIPDSAGYVANEIITDLLALLTQAHGALEILSEEADNFSVSGVYFSEKIMGHRGIELARDAITAIESAGIGVSNV